MFFPERTHAYYIVADFVSERDTRLYTRTLVCLMYVRYAISLCVAQPSTLNLIRLAPDELQI